MLMPRNVQLNIIILNEESTMQKYMYKGQLHSSSQ